MKEREIEMYLLNDSNDRKLFRKKSGIYGLIYDNQVIYVGQSKNLEDRLNRHKNYKSGLNSLMHQVIKEGGRSNYTKSFAKFIFTSYHLDEIYFVILKECEVKDLNYYEEKYIKKFQPIFNYRGVNIPFQSVYDNSNDWTF